MTTSSSETSKGARCTRISPSAILDDRLGGRDLDWARDHLRRCDTCRNRVEDFQEMRLRLERMAHAPVSNAAIEDAFVVVVPEALRPLPSQARLVGTPHAPPPAEIQEVGVRSPALETFPPPPLDVASVPDLLSELEHEIFRDDPWGGHPAGLSGLERDMETEPEAAMSADARREANDVDEPPSESRTELPAVESPPPFSLREVPVESGPRTDAVPMEGVHDAPAFVAPDAVAPDAGEPAAGWPQEAEDPETEERVVASAVAPGKPDTVMRLAVGLGAAGCVLLAALLYESGLFSTRPTSSVSTRPTPSVAARPTSRPSVAVSGSPSIAPSPTPPPAAVVARLGQGVTGESVFRIRPGTANPTWTRLVFDLTGSGLPTMVITQPDALHLQVTFYGTGGANVPVGGIHSRQVVAVEPAVQQGSDLVITIDLAAPMRLVDFTLPPEQGYAPRLVLDIHSS